MYTAKFVTGATERAGVIDPEFNAVCGYCGDALGRRASFPEGRVTDYITCMHCGVTNEVRKPRRAA